MIRNPSALLCRSCAKKKPALILRNNRRKKHSIAMMKEDINTAETFATFSYAPIL